MTVASLIERLKQVPTHQNTPEKTPGVLVKNEAVRGENRQNTPNTPNTPEKAGGQSANQKLPPSWTAPAPLPDPGLPRLLSAVATLCDATKASDAERADWLADKIDQLLNLAMKWADYTGDSEEARRQWREDVEATPQALRAGLAKYLQGQIRAARASGYSTRRPVPAMCRSFG